MGNRNLYMMGVLLEKRNNEAPEVQKVFTKHGDIIMSRLGIHEYDDPNGLISLNIRSTEDDIIQFESELTAIEGVSVKHMQLK